MRRLSYKLFKNTASFSAVLLLAILRPQTATEEDFFIYPLPD
jgi:hypothetical protein